MLQPHTIKPAYGSKRKKKNIGRGNASGHGTSSTRGGKGQTARSGGSRGLKRLGFKPQLMSAKKLGGFRSIHAKPSEIYLSDLEKHFNAGDTITIEVLKEKNLIGASVKAAKVLNSGELKKKLTLQGIAATKSAVEKIKAVGGELV